MKSFKKVIAGEIGGYVETEKNLSQEGGSWVQDMAMVYEDAQVYEDAVILENARIHGKAKIYGNAQIYGSAQVFDLCRVFDCAQVFGFCRVYDGAYVLGNASVSGDVIITGKAQIYDNARICNEGLSDCCSSWIGEDAQICGEAVVEGLVVIGKDALIKNTDDWKNFMGGDEEVILTVYRTVNGSIKIFQGNANPWRDFFQGTVEDYVKFLEGIYKNIPRIKKYNEFLQQAIKLWFGN